MIGLGIAVQKGTEFMKQSVTAASNLSETVNKTSVVFGKSADAIIDKSDEVSESMGLSAQSFLDAASTFGVFGKSAGLAGEDLATFSTDLVQLTSDMASFSNTTPEEAIMAVGAALRGESEPIRRYGVLLDDATLRQEALAMGIINTTKNALTPQQRVLAAQAVIFKQTKDAQGDFARTSDGLANSQKILKAEVENLKVEVGKGLIPIVTSATQGFVDFIQILNGTYEASKYAKGGLNDLKNTLNDLMIAGRKQAEQQETLTAAYELGLISLDEYKAMQRKLEYSSKDLTGAMAPIEKELNDLYVAADSLGNSELNLIKIQKDLTGGTNDLAISIDDLAIVAEDATEAIEDEKNAMSDMEWVISQPLTEAIEEFNVTQGELQTEMGKVQGEIDELNGMTYLTPEQQQELDDLKQEQINLQTEYDKNATEHERATARIIFDLGVEKLAAEGLLTSGIFEDMAEAWGLVEDAEIQAMIHADEATNWLKKHPDDIAGYKRILEGQATAWSLTKEQAALAKGEVMGYTNYLNALDGKVVNVYVDTWMREYQGEHNRASGGPVGAGQAYWVGEQGPEIFVPNTSGSIIPNSQVTNNNFNINMTGTGSPSSDITSTVRLLELLYG
jgi:hypothetical protein